MPQEQTLKAVNIHRLRETVTDGLAYQGMFRDFALTLKILRAGDLVGKYRPHQVLGAHAGQLRFGTFLPPRKRGNASATPITQRQRVVNIGESCQAGAWVSTVRTELECR